jgi:predicted DNA binding CopG/RHH family protein
MPKQVKTELKKLKTIPKFKSEVSERQFWKSHENDTTKYFDVSKMKMAIFSNLKPSTTRISLLLSDSLLEGIRQQANKLDVPYQSLMKIWLAEKLGESVSN